MNGMPRAEGVLQLLECAEASFARQLDELSELIEPDEAS
jgi:hypothetical protein